MPVQRKTKAYAIGLILAGLLLIALLIAYGDIMPIPLMVSLIICASIITPFGATLIPLLAEVNSRKRTKRIYLIVSITLFVAGFISKKTQFVGANIEIILAVLWYCFAFAPLELKDKYLKWAVYSYSKLETLLLSAVDFVGLNLVVLGFLFKIMHWPLATILMSWGGIITLAGLFLWNKKFKKEVVKRKEAEDKIKEQYKEIHDSISYAKRIQNAILPPQRIVKEYLPQSFIFYKPKDIVAGDFFWLEHKDNKVLFAAADCTGHGVPGAMVSVICNNGLNRSVREYGLTRPGKILDKTREIVIQEFEKSDEEVKDGMDISLCSLSIDTKTLEWAGANNPIWIIRNGKHEVEEIKANKQPIGKYSEPVPFVTHVFNLQSGDSIYVFTDGLQDQFGGEKGKKFKAGKLKEFLLSIQHKSMEEQRIETEKAFQNWKGNLEQVDDVCIIGVKIE